MHDSSKSVSGDVYIYGDYKYGADALDKDLWGDDDIIYGGNEDTNSYDIEISAGDGDDIIHTGNGWVYGYIRGQNGERV